jgi:hypothetical protein
MRTLLSLVWSRGQAVLAIRPLRVVANVGYRSLLDPRSVTVRLSHHGPRPAAGWPFVRFDAETYPSIRMETTGTAPYLELGHALPAEIREPLQPLLPRLRGRALPVLLQIPGTGEEVAALHAPAWEAALALAVAGGSADPPAAQPFLPYRTVVEGRQYREILDGVAQGVALWTRSSVTSSVLERAWQNRVTVRLDAIRQQYDMEESHFKTWDADLKAGRGSVPVAELTHLVGTVREGVDLLFFPDEEGAYQANVQSSMAQSAEYADQGLPAYRVLDYLPATTLYLLQLAPQAGAAAIRSDADRRAAMLARAFAGRLFQAGAPAVLCLPCVDPELTLILIARLHDKFDHLNEPARLLKLARALRGDVFDYYPAEGDAAWEIAMDITLYLP